MINLLRGNIFRTALLLAIILAAPAAWAQDSHLDFLNHNQPIVDAHNCYPYDGKWENRIHRALNSGFPVSIEQDLAWYVDPATGKGRVVLHHGSHPTGKEPTLRSYFFSQARPIVEKALAENHRSEWPLIILHFDFKENRPAILKAVWKILGEYQSWLCTAVKTSDPHRLSPIERRPILAITEDSDAQQKVFYQDVPVGGRLLVFGSAHTHPGPSGATRRQQMHWEATAPPSELLTERPTNYRRWWNNSWYVVEEGGEPHAGAWTSQDDRRLRELVDYAHQMGYWIRFYTLDGFNAAQDQGWGQGYNFGSRAAVVTRWKAAIAAGVNFVATDQYEDLAHYMKQEARNLRPAAIAPPPSF